MNLILFQKIWRRSIIKDTRLWLSDVGEWITSLDDMYQRTFPRLAAYAEVGWTKLENKILNVFNNLCLIFIINGVVRG